MIDQHIRHRLLERSCYIRLFDLNLFHSASIQIIQYRRLQSTETEIIDAVRNLCTRKSDRIRIALMRYLLNLRSTRITKSDRTCDLVESLTCRIVPRSSKDLIHTIILHLDKMGVSTGYDKTQKRRLKLRILNIIGTDMSLDMMDSYQWNISCITDCLGRCDTD